jgi:hypothetical protein
MNLATRGARNGIIGAQDLEEGGVEQELDPFLHFTRSGLFLAQGPRTRIGSFLAQHVPQSPSDQAESLQAIFSPNKLDLLETRDSLLSHQVDLQIQVSTNESSNSNSSAEEIINMLLNKDQVSRRGIIIKLVSHTDIRTRIKEVLSSVPIESQAIFNKVPVK